MRALFSKIRSVFRRRSERGIALLVTAVMLVFIIPMVGLSVDVGILYAIRTKLSMACDAGALAGARSLSRGMTDSEQVANAQAIAQQYVDLNLPSNYFGASTPTVTVTVNETVANQRSVAVTATSNAPLYFLRWLGSSSTQISYSATATRRDVNVMIVMDRSGSLADTGSCVPLQQAAITFVNKFANGRDNVGVTTFATSSMVDFPAATNFLSASTNIPTILGELTCTGATSTALGLYNGYSQLIGLNQPNALNVILLFTDGYPTALTAAFPIKSSSSCTSKAAKTAVLTVGFNLPNLTTPVAVGGLLSPVAQPQPMSSDLGFGPAGNYSGCSYASNLWNVGNDVSYIPNTDSYGNAINTNYQPVTYYDGNGDVSLDPTSVMNASVNAADSMGYRIRTGAALSGVGPGISGVYVYTIGLGNAGGVSDDFLERVANDPRASNYNSNYPSGLYIYAPTSADLTDAFNQIASQILHLSK